MTTTIPNLWEGKFSPSAVTPLAVIRTHAVNFNSQAGGLLRAEVESRSERRDEVTLRVIAFDILAPTLDYRQGVFTVEHPDPGAYPVVVRSAYLAVTARTCYTQADLVKVLEKIAESTTLLTTIESLIAQINDTDTDD